MTYQTYNQSNKQSTLLVVPARKNAHSKGLGPRAHAIREQQTGHDARRDKYHYDHRWPATEGEFSAVKRDFGETLRSHNKTDLYHEARLKFWTYQRLRTATTTT